MSTEAKTDNNQPIKLGEKRSEYYWNRKLIAGSTPTVAGASRIEQLFEAGDRRVIACNTRAAVSPAMPAPTTSTWVSGSAATITQATRTANRRRQNRDTCPTTPDLPQETP